MAAHIALNFPTSSFLKLISKLIGIMLEQKVGFLNVCAVNAKTAPPIKNSYNTSN